MSCWTCRGQSKVPLKVLESLQEAPRGGRVAMPHCTTLRRRRRSHTPWSDGCCGRIGHVPVAARSSGASFGRAASAARCFAMSRSMSAKTALNSGSLRIDARLGSKSR